MSKFLDENDQLIRFVLLTCGLLTLAGAVACLLLGNAILAVACCIVSAWAIGFYLDTMLARVSGTRRGRIEEEPQDFRTYK
jgi:uncharacterized membrane protein